MNKDQVKGRVNEITGKAKELAGKVTRRLHSAQTEVRCEMKSVTSC